MGSDDPFIEGIENLDSRTQEGDDEQPGTRIDWGDDDTWDPDWGDDDTWDPDWGDDDTWDPDWGDDDTWDPDMEEDSVSSLEEDVTKEIDTYSDESDSDYVPRVCVRTGGALTTNLRLETLPTVTLEESVLDVDFNRDPARPDTPLPEAMKVEVEDDVIGHPASIVYHDCLKQLAGDDPFIEGIENLDSRTQEGDDEQPGTRIDWGDDDTWDPDWGDDDTWDPDWGDDDTWDPDWGDDDTWDPDMEEDSVSSLEEDVTKEIDTYSDESDSDYVPRVCVRTGGALTTNLRLETLPTVTLEESVLDVDFNRDPARPDTPLPEAMKVEVEDDVIGHPASIVYHDCLKQLAGCVALPMAECTEKEPMTNKPCPAKAPFEIRVKSRGTAAVVEWMCSRGHLVWRWSSQSLFKFGMLAGDFMLATNILLSGNNYAKIALLFQFMNMGMVDRTNFFKIQDSFCVESVKEFWNDKRAKVIAQLKQRGPVVVLGDGRMDSPGFCAQYCTYTAMDNDSKQIISMVNLDKRETNRNSVIMEKEGFVRTLETLREELNVTEVCTDAHSQIAALFNKGLFKDSGIHHSWDIWHGSKNLNKKLVAAGQQKGCAGLLAWSRDICNHFWHCCKTSNSYRQFMDMWSGLLHHVTGEHEWSLYSCHHGPLEDSRDKEWIEADSLAHQRLREIVLDARWLKNIDKYLHF
ncbi:PREDICTED: uncharacterized protein LOC107098251, partial [Cyprinodon variegatus]|uniref:uncharacterized protein LOC107098251 n=1 Tax=Cyprinodon variegatus TaxID=28743 RepID=UPI0007426C0E